LLRRYLLPVRRQQLIRITGKEIGKRYAVEFRAHWIARRRMSAEHRAAAEAARPDYLAAVAEGRTEESGVFVGEAIGLMRDVSPAAEILARVTKEAEALLRGRATEFIV
jgi:NAD(P)H-dependent flavin oxidoreductase YrpB (nitropropane dioxygenase family)